MRVPARAPRWIVPAVKVALVITDAFAAALSFMLAFYTRERISIFATSEGFAWSERFAPYGCQHQVRGDDGEQCDADTGPE